MTDFNPAINTTKEPEDIKKLIVDALNQAAIDIIAAIIAKFS